MKPMQVQIPLLVCGVVFSALACYYTWGVMGRADDAAELALKRMDAVLLTLLWPLAFAFFVRGFGMAWRRVGLWAVVVLFLAWVLGAGSMQKEYSRGGSERGVLGF